MTEQYDKGGRLTRIYCDGACCTESIQPGPTISASGWMRHGIRTDSGEKLEWTYCPSCWIKLEGVRL